jgi:hypothetical protein
LRRKKIVLYRASSCRPSSLFFASREGLVMNLLESALEKIANGAEEINGRAIGLDLESVRRLMAACCSASSKVKKLDLAWCGLAAEAAEVIASSLRSNNALTVLSLTGNEIGLPVAHALGKLLCVNVMLRVLHLFRCSVGDEGAGHFAVALRQNRTLEQLWLGENGITHLGAVAFASALPFNQTLKRLTLDRNPLVDVEALAKAVPFSGLHELWLTGTRFQERVCAALVEMLKNGSRMRLLRTDSDHWPALEEGFRCNGWLMEFAPQQYLERNKAMHLQARKSVYSLLLIRKLRRTALSLFPKEVVREVAQFVYSSRGEVSVWHVNEQ